MNTSKASNCDTMIRVFLFVFLGTSLLYGAPETESNNTVGTANNMEGVTLITGTTSNSGGTVSDPDIFYIVNSTNAPITLRVDLVASGDPMNHNFGIHLLDAAGNIIEAEDGSPAGTFGIQERLDIIIPRNSGKIYVAPHPAFPTTGIAMDYELSVSIYRGDLGVGLKKGALKGEGRFDVSSRGQKVKLVKKKRKSARAIIKKSYNGTASGDSLRLRGSKGNRKVRAKYLVSGEGNVTSQVVTSGHTDVHVSANGSGSVGTFYRLVLKRKGQKRARRNFRFSVVAGIDIANTSVSDAALLRTKFNL